MKAAACAFPDAVGAGRGARAFSRALGLGG
jgi:hypothetical protein